MGENKVTFINAVIEDAGIDNQYDVVITPFLLDNFTDGALQKIFLQLDAALEPKGIWLYSDFQNTNVLWQKAVLKIMYLFFRSFCGIDATHLPDVDTWFGQKKYQLKEEKIFLKGFVAARVYEKTQL